MKNKKTLFLALTLAIVMITTTFLTAAAKSPMIDVSGTITSKAISGFPIVTKTVGENIFRYIETTSTWAGTIVGSTSGSQTQITHTGPDVDQITVNVELLFSTATVNGKTGTMTVEMVMIMYVGSSADNHGTWRIKDASGGLEGLHGEGVWLSAPNRYEGKVHFTS